MKKDNKISSGAEKVENINKESGAEKSEKIERKSGSEKSVKHGRNAAAIERENERAEARLEAAMERENKKREKQAEMQHRRADMAADRIAAHERREAEMEERRAAHRLAQEKKAEERLAAREKRKAEMEERRAEQIAARERKLEERRERASARATLSASERKEQKRAMRAEREERRREQHAHMMEERERKREERAARRAERGDRRDRTPGFGGWITAVVSLSVMVLALGAVVTVGYFNLQNVRSNVSNGYTGSFYELMSFVDNMDTNLSKARVANGRYEQQKLLTNVVVESELCENCLESFPVSVEKTENLTSFINRVSDYSRSLLNKLAKGGKLSEEEGEVIQYMYETTNALKNKLNETVNSLDSKEINKILDGHSEVFDKGFAAMENDTIQMPKMIYDGPFAQSANSGDVKLIAKMGETSEKEAKEKIAAIFEKHDMKEIDMTGETKLRNIELYNFEMKDNAGRMFSAQMTKKGGVLAMFDSYEKCEAHNFDVEACVEIAENFLEKAGFDDMQEVWISEAGTECTINFAYEQNGVVCYSDLVKVKVCEEKGAVIGLEANSYIRSHTERKLPAAKLSMKEARAKLKNGFEAETERLCLIPVDNTETLAYEFSGEYGGSTYYVYIDAVNGSECELFTVVGSNQGRALM